MIEMREIVKTFDGFAALDGASLSVPAGSVYGLVGPNGAGKSTLIRHLTGIYRQDSGQVLISGKEVWENAALKARIAAIPDDWYYFLQAFTGAFIPPSPQSAMKSSRRCLPLMRKRPSAASARACRSRWRSGWPSPACRTI